MFQLTEKDVKENTKFACLWFFLKNQSLEKTIVDLDSYGITKNKNQLSGILFNLKLQIKTVPSVKASLLGALGEDYERIMALEQWINVGFRNKNKSSITVITNQSPVILPESNISASPFAIRKERKSTKPKLKLVKSESQLEKESNSANEPLGTKEPVNGSEPELQKEPIKVNEPHPIIEPLRPIEPSYPKETSKFNEPTLITEPYEDNEFINPIESSKANESSFRLEPQNENEPVVNIEPSQSNESPSSKEPYENNESVLFKEPNGSNVLSKPVVIMDLNIDTCRFPLWEFNEKPTLDSLYCGGKINRSLGKSYYSCYCEKHLKIVKGAAVKNSGNRLRKCK